MFRSRWHRISFTVFAVVGFLVALRWLPRQPAPLQDPQQIHQVRRVIDGETLLLVDGQQVRLLGIDTPEPLAEDASDFLDAALADRHVSFGFDRETHDKLGRRLVYAYHQGRCLNEAIIRAGFSRAEFEFPCHESMRIRFRQAEREAREQRRGIWSGDNAAPARGESKGSGRDTQNQSVHD